MQYHKLKGFEMNKITIVTGHKTKKPENWEQMSINERFNSNWNVDSFHRPGFWKKESIVKLSKKMGFIGEIDVIHKNMDYSGKGRTYTRQKQTYQL